MIGRKRKETTPDTIETLIGPTANFVGDLKSDGGVRIEGLLEGSLETAGNLAVEGKARIFGDVIAHNVSIAGTIRGNITANRVEVLGTGKVWGDVSVNAFLLDEGGFIHGQINMQGEDVAPPWPTSDCGKSSRSGCPPASTVQRSLWSPCRSPLEAPCESTLRRDRTLPLITLGKCHREAGYHPEAMYRT